jgi:hypothetical protein
MGYIVIPKFMAFDALRQCQISELVEPDLTSSFASYSHWNSEKALARFQLGVDQPTSTTLLFRSHPQSVLLAIGENHE